MNLTLNFDSSTNTVAEQLIFLNTQLNLAYSEVGPNDRTTKTLPGFYKMVHGLGMLIVGGHLTTPEALYINLNNTTSDSQWLIMTLECDQPFQITGFDQPVACTTTSLVSLTSDKTITLAFPAKSTVRLLLFSLDPTSLATKLETTSPFDTEPIEPTNWLVEEGVETMSPTLKQASKSLFDKTNQQTMPLLANAFLLTLVCYLVDKREHAVTHSLNSRDLISIQRVKQDMVRGVYSQFPGLRYLAHQAGMSLSKFRYCFEEVYGMPPYTFYLEHRLTTVNDLLTQSTLTISEIAIQIGYATPTSLNKAYKKKYGHSPNKVRRHERDKSEVYTDQ